MHWTLNQDMMIGIDKIDEQHQVLVDILNCMSRAIIQGSEDDVVSEILEELHHYTEFHFSYEEEQFEKYGYPDAQQHAQAHQHLVQKLADLKTQYQACEIDLTSSMMDLLTDWVFGHIRGSDMRFQGLLARVLC